MQLATLIQILAACFGVLGSLFFAIGVMRQSVEAMAQLSGTYWGWNPHMIKALAAQKADYLFGGAIIVLAFSTQLFSYLIPSTVMVFGGSGAERVPWAAVLLTALAFPVLRLAAMRLASGYEKEIRSALDAKEKANDSE